MAKNEETGFENLNPTERARVVSVAKLTQHFRGLEKAGLLSEQNAGSYIGAIKILEAQANGTFQEKSPKLM